VDLVLDHTINPRCIIDLFGLPLNLDVSQIESPSVERITEQDIEENFNTYHNLVVEPTLSPRLEEFGLLNNIAHEEMRNEEIKGEETFGFPILDLEPNVAMKYIPPLVLPNSQGMSTEYPNAFLFEFDILCRIYYYANNAQKVKMFPMTLK
jgi:hypothetical protein